MIKQVCKKCIDVCNWTYDERLLTKRCNYEVYIQRWRHGFIPDDTNVTYTKSFYEMDIFKNLTKYIKYL